MIAALHQIHNDLLVVAFLLGSIAGATVIAAIGVWRR